MKINIQNKEIELKYSFRALLIYENIQKKSFEPNSLTDIIVYIYSTILASDKTLNLEFDDFLEYLDENPNVINDFTEWLQDNVNKQAQLSPEQPKEDNRKPKKK